MKKLIFLDRDGVINKDLNTYVTQHEDFEFLPGVLEALRDLTEADYEIAIISNQAGIAKGIYTPEELDEVNKKMLAVIESAGARISRVEYCLHEDSDNCTCRKPKTGLFKRVLDEKDLNLKEVYFIGDKESDVIAGKNIGCKTILVLCGKTKAVDVENWQTKPDYIKQDLREAVSWLLNEESK
jgi:D-glycero-D-manno-heptose 1,7-bisphosphate phosphatase